MIPSYFSIRNKSSIIARNQRESEANADQTAVEDTLMTIKSKRVDVGSAALVWLRQQMESLSKTMKALAL